MLSSILAGVGAAGILANADRSLARDGRARRSGSTFMVAATFILLTTWLVARGAEESSRTTLILTIIQYGGLALFAVHHARRRCSAVSAEPGRGVVLLGVVQPVRHPRLQRPAGRLPGGRSSSSGGSTPRWPCRRRPPAAPAQAGRSGVTAIRDHRRHLRDLQRGRTGVRGRRREQSRPA